MKKFLFITFILSILFLAGCVKSPQTANQNQVSQPKPESIANLNQAQPATNLVTLDALVIDKNTKKTVPDAFVYIGTGEWQCVTFAEGKCNISNKQFVFGDYAIGAYKRGYLRSVINTKLVPGSNSLTLEIAPLVIAPTYHDVPIIPNLNSGTLEIGQADTPAKSITVTGTVIEVVTALGSMSENRYYKIKTETGEEYYLFNEIGYNTGFASIVNKKVTIIGYLDLGFIGWQHQEAKGLYFTEVLVEQTPDLSCAQDSDCKIYPTTCGPCDCGQAVNINWKPDCPIQRKQLQVVACAMCPPYQAKCVNNKCQEEIIKI